MTLEIITFCHNFQHRLCWVLSSIAQQSNPAFDITVNLAVIKNNGKPTTEEIVEYYKDKLNIKLTYFKPEDYAYSGLTRNRQIAESNAEWIMQHSCDFVIHPGYFKMLHNYLTEHRNLDCCLRSAGKYHTNVEPTNLFVGNAFYHEDAYNRAASLPRDRFDGRSGGHIIFRRQAVIEKNDGYYVRPERCKDHHLFNEGMKTWSEKAFRSLMGGCKRENFPPHIHLNHRRDKEAGRHLEEQR